MLHRKLLIGLLITLVFAGCSKGRLEKVIVEGTVIYDGVPVENGEVRLHPIEGTIGPVSGAPIVNGRYRVVGKGGAPVGTHAVRIIGYKTNGGGGDGGDMISGGDEGGARVNYIPSKYNDNSELVLTVPGDSKTMTHDFDLQP